MAKNRNIKIDLVLGLKGKGVDEAVKDVQKLGKNIQTLSGTAIKAAAAFAAFKGAAVLGDFAKQSVTEAQSIERGLAALGTVFGEQGPEMLKFAQGASEIGLSMTEAAKASTFLGSVLKQSGFAIDETAELTQRLVRLANDLAITYQYDVQEALLAMTALFRGEYDPIEKFGVAMKQNEIEGVKLERGLDKLTGRAEIFADQQIRLELLFQRATDAEGAYARQTETLFVRQQQLAAVFKNVQATVGLALTPSLEKLTYAMIPVVEQLTPVMIQLFQGLVEVVNRVVANKDQLIGVVFGLINIFGGLIKIVFRATQHIVEHINVYKNLAIAFGAIVVGVKLFGVMITAIQGATVAARLLNIQLSLTNKQLRIMKLRLAATGLGLIALGVGAAAVGIMGLTSEVEDAIPELEELDQVDMEALMAEMAGATSVAQDFSESLDEVATAGAGVEDAVGKFYGNLQNEILKQRATLQLEALGASEGLINAVLGSGEDWYRVFADVTRRGAESIAEVQAMFAQTPAGFDEAMQEFEEQKRKFEEFKKAALEAKDSLVDFVRSFEILPTIERELGRFEQAAVTQLENIEERLDDAFDNGYLLEESYRNLQQYARQEFQVLAQIERQRDDLLRRRDAAERLINSVNDAVLSSGRLVNVLRNVQTETQNVDMVKVVKDTIEEASGLREFEVILTSAVIEPIEEVQSKSQQLVSGYQNIVDRTRQFVANMKALRQLGLDPQLFNELVEAGVDAGGATAEALIEGGSETVREVNSLFDELNSLGEELGEETAQVMYGQGEMFVDGIVRGLEDQASQLEEQAIALAGAFTESFEALLISGIEIAIAKAQVALGRMPTLEGMPSFTGGAGGGDGSAGGAGGDGGEIPMFATPATVQAMVDKRRQEVEDMRRVAAEQAARARDAMARQAAQQEKVSVSRSSGVGIGGERPTNYTVINTGQSTRAVEVAISRANASRGSSRPITSVRALADRGIA